MVAGWRRRAGRRDEGGASAVEFALVLPVLLLLIFGIIDYGLLFFDSIGLKQGSREAARQAVVLRVDPTCGSLSYANMACTALKASDNVLGQGNPKVKSMVKVLDASGNPAAWAVGNQLWICTQTSERSTTGFIPFPANGIIKSKTIMSIEQPSPALAGAGATSFSDAAPTGGNWSWCTNT